MDTRNRAITRAVALVGDGTHKAFAEEVGVSPAAVSHWATGFRRVAPKHVRAIERATNGRVTRHDLRPDIFGSTTDS